MKLYFYEILNSCTNCKINFSSVNGIKLKYPAMPPYCNFPPIYIQELFIKGCRHFTTVFIPYRH